MGSRSRDHRDCTFTRTASVFSNKEERAQKKKQRDKRHRDHPRTEATQQQECNPQEKSQWTENKELVAEAASKDPKAEEDTFTQSRTADANGTKTIEILRQHWKQTKSTDKAEGWVEEAQKLSSQS